MASRGRRNSKRSAALPHWRRVRRFALPLLAALLLLGSILVLRLEQRGVSVREAERSANVGCSQAARAFQGRLSNRWLTVAARVSRVLPDEYGTYEHQRFIVRCPSGSTILIVNDVSVGQRAPVRPGDRVVVRGQYVWNTQGGLIHFTHHGGAGSQSGWILLHGNLYAWVEKVRDKEVENLESRWGVGGRTGTGPD